MSELVVFLSVLGCVAWLSLLTRDHRRHVRQCVDGEPVYRRLPDGRVRFSWLVSEQLASSERHADPGRTEPIR